MIVHIPGLKLVSEANSRGHWRVKAKRVKSQRNTVALMLRGPIRDQSKLLREVRVGGFWMRTLAVPVVVTMTRFAPGAGIKDSDNLVSAFKACRDQVAMELGVDDSDPRITWRVEQQRSAGGMYAVEIRIEPARAKALPRKRADKAKDGAA